MHLKKIKKLRSANNLHYLQKGTLVATSRSFLHAALHTVTAAANCRLVPLHSKSPGEPMAWKSQQSLAPCFLWILRVNSGEWVEGLSGLSGTCSCNTGWDHSGLRTLAWGTTLHNDWPSSTQRSHSWYQRMRDVESRPNRGQRGLRMLTNIIWSRSIGMSYTLHCSSGALGQVKVQLCNILIVIWQ